MKILNRLHKYSDYRSARKIRIALAAASMLATILTGCGLLTNGHTAVLWTSLPSVAAYAERFNEEQTDYHIQVTYREDAGRALQQTEEPPDLVVATGLASRDRIRNFASLDRLFEKGLLESKAFYPELLALGRVEEKQTVLPLSFTLPALLFPSDVSGELEDSHRIALEEVEAMCREFAETTETPTRMGLSLRWDPSLLYSVAVLLGAGFRETSEGEPAWFDRELQNAVEYARTWSTEINGGVHVEELFHDTYMYDPMYKLLNRRRIMFAYTDPGAYLTIPAEIRENLGFRWLAREGKIPVLNDIVYLGRHRQARNRKAADAFIEWLYQAGTQKRLLEISQFTRIRSFGVAGGFSSLPLVNEISLPQFYPFLVGRIPPASYLAFQPVLPADWRSIRAEVVEPWLVEQASGSEEISPLSDRLWQWRLQSPTVP